MTKLTKLGVNCAYDPNKPEELKYSVSIKPGKLNGPEQTKEYFRNVINTVANDAKAKGGLEHLAISVDGGSQECLESVAQELLNKAVENDADNTPFHKYVQYHLVKLLLGTYSGGIIGGATTGLAALIGGMNHPYEAATVGAGVGALIGYCRAAGLGGADSTDEYNAHFASMSQKYESILKGIQKSEKQPTNNENI